VVLTSGGLVAATAGGPVVTSVVPSTRLRMLSVLDNTARQNTENLLEENTVGANVVSSNA
jgi:hypothetical protein